MGQRVRAIYDMGQWGQRVRAIYDMGQWVKESGLFMIWVKESGYL